MHNTLLSCLALEYSVSVIQDPLNSVPNMLVIKDSRRRRLIIAITVVRLQQGTVENIMNLHALRQLQFISHRVDPLENLKGSDKFGQQLPCISRACLQSQTLGGQQYLSPK